VAGRALSLSLAGHAALILAFLLLSATRQPARIAEIVRPIRLIASIESRPATVPRPRTARPVESAAAQPAPGSAPRAETARVPDRPAPAESPTPVAVSKIIIPTTRPPATPPSGTRPTPAAVSSSLSERLSRRLSTAAPAEVRAPAPSGPQIAALAPQEPPAAPQHPVAGSVTAASPGGAVMPVGDFPHSWYLTLLRERIYARWSPPSQFYVGGRSPSASVAFRISRSGRIDRIALKAGSGSARFDQSALSAVQGLGQAPALPEQYPEETLDVIIRFQNE
jgi:TonB family protein